MVKLSWGKDGQLQFANEAEYYEVLGALCNSDVFKISFEENTKTDSWEDAYRIRCEVDKGKLLNPLKNAARDRNRINCNEFIINLYEVHNFEFNSSEKKLYANVSEVRKTVPAKYINDFDKGFSMY